jgi:hypothetical protein
MLEELEIHAHSMVVQDNNSNVHKRYISLTARIYVIYTMYIPCIYHIYRIFLLDTMDPSQPPLNDQLKISSNNFLIFKIF